jgi:hypothetical protein
MILNENLQSIRGPDNLGMVTGMPLYRMQAKNLSFCGQLYCRPFIAHYKTPSGNIHTGFHHSQDPGLQTMAMQRTRESKQLHIQPSSESRVKASSPNMSERLVNIKSAIEFAIEFAISGTCKGIKELGV